MIGSSDTQKSHHITSIEACRWRREFISFYVICNFLQRPRVGTKAFHIVWWLLHNLLCEKNKKKAAAKSTWKTLKNSKKSSSRCVYVYWHDPMDATVRCAFIWRNEFGKISKFFVDLITYWTTSPANNLTKRKNTRETNLMHVCICERPIEICLYVVRIVYAEFPFRLLAFHFQFES